MGVISARQVQRGAPLGHIGELSKSKDWIIKLYTSADKARQQQPQRGRPPKPTAQARQKKPVEQTAPENDATVIAATNA